MIGEFLYTDFLFALANAQENDFMHFCLVIIIVFVDPGSAPAGLLIHGKRQNVFPCLP